MNLYRLYLNLKAPDGQSMNFGWQKCRREFFKAIKHKECVCCRSKKKIEVHHILPRHIRPDLAVDFTNLIALCKGCHLRIAHLGSYFTYNEAIKLVAFFVRDNSILKKNEAA